MSTGICMVLLSSRFTPQWPFTLRAAAVVAPLSSRPGSQPVLTPPPLCPLQSRHPLCLSFYRTLPEVPSLLMWPSTQRGLPWLHRVSWPTPIIPHPFFLLQNPHFQVACHLCYLISLTSAFPLKLPAPGGHRPLHCSFSRPKQGLLYQLWEETIQLLPMLPLSHASCDFPATSHKLSLVTPLPP